MLTIDDIYSMDITIMQINNNNGGRRGRMSWDGVIEIILTILMVVLIYVGTVILFTF